MPRAGTRGTSQGEEQESREDRAAEMPLEDGVPGVDAEAGDGLAEGRKCGGKGSDQRNQRSVCSNGGGTGPEAAQIALIVGREIDRRHRRGGRSFRWFGLPGRRTALRRERGSPISS
jgi:hypothetical protein